MYTRIAGIPCEVRVTYFMHQKALGPSADNRDDCYGYDEIEFEVFDRKGYPATWLENKLTDRERERIEEELLALQNDD